MNENNVSWPGWKVVRKIGSGSFGGVYEIQRDVFGNVEKAALKVISIPQNRDEIEDFRVQGYDDLSITQHFEGYLQDIVHEYSLMAKMKGHTNVVYCDDVRYVQHDDGIGWDIFIKMELLNPLMKNLHMVATEEQIIRLGVDICNALVLCKERNIIHRDIKPQNIFVSDDGNFKLGDFGIAKTVERTTGGTKVGTYKYMAPEVYNNQPYGLVADLYSLGLVLYWLLNDKRTPFLPGPPQIPTPSMEDEARLRRFRGDVLPAPAHGSAELKRIVLKACAFDVKQRYASAAEMLDDLKKARTGATAVHLPNTVCVAAAAEEPTERVSVTEDEGTVNIFASHTGQPAADEPTEYARDDKTEMHSKAAQTPQPVQPEKKPKKKTGKWILLIAGLAAIVVLLLLMLRFCSSNDGAHTEDPATTGQTDITETFLEETEPSQESTEPPVTEPPVTEPPVTEPPPPVTHEIPNVVGKTESVAKAALTKLNFIVETDYTKDDTVAEGNVIAQSVKAGTQLEEGSTIVLKISSGKPTIKVNDVVGKSQAAAKSSLEGQGFTVEFMQEYSATVPSGSVTRQSPRAGSDQYKGTKIILYVSKGPEPVLPTGVTLNKNNVTLQIGETVQFNASVSPSDAMDKRVTWQSSNTAVATISAEGFVKAVAPGTATITATTITGGKTATCKITVLAPTIGTISNVSMFIGDSKAVANPSFTPTSATVTWSSSNTAVATVSGKSTGCGIVAKGTGSAVIKVTVTAGSSSVSTTFTVNVTKPQVTLSYYNHSSTFDVSTYGVFTTNNKPSWDAPLPTATANTGSSVYWEVYSGEAFIASRSGTKKLFVTIPGETVVARAYFWYNGVKYYADYRHTLSVTKYTTASNYLRVGPGVSYDYHCLVPKGQTLIITEVYWDYSMRNKDGLYWAWGKVNYNGYTGWVVVF